MRTLPFLAVLLVAAGLAFLAWRVTSGWGTRPEPILADWGALAATTSEPHSRPDALSARREPSRQVNRDVQLQSQLAPDSDPGTEARGPELESFYANGQRQYLGSQVEIEPGVWSREGAWTAWHDNGAIDEQGAYWNDGEDGLWQWWYPDGQRKAIGHWSEGKRFGKWKFWHESGRLLTVAHYVNGKGHGPWTLYYESGLKRAEGHYSGGEISGPWTVWHEDGSINEQRSGTYLAGEKAP